MWRTLLWHQHPIVCREHIISSLRQSEKVSSRPTAPPRRAIALASADSAPLPAGYQFTSSPATSAMYAGPPLDLLERDLSDSQVSSAHLYYSLLSLLLLLLLLLSIYFYSVLFFVIIHYCYYSLRFFVVIIHYCYYSAHDAPVQAQGSSTNRVKACSGLCLL